MIIEHEDMKAMIEKYEVCPHDGANEQSFEMFSEWYSLAKDRKTELDYEVSKFDVESLVSMFDQDLWDYWKSVSAEHNSTEKEATGDDKF